MKIEKIFAIAALALVATVTQPAVAQSDAPTAGARPPACFVYANTKAGRFEVSAKNRTAACQPGASVRFYWANANDYLIEQLCDISKPIHRKGEGSDETVICTFTGEVLEPDRDFSGARIVLMHR